MQRSFAWVMIAVVAIMLAPLAGVLGVPASAVQADTAAPTAAADDEIVVITSELQLRVDDPTTPPGIQPVTWSSASVPGWESGWTVVAAGDFNGDGDAELVAARSTTTGNPAGSYIKVFDPVVQPGSALVDFNANLSLDAPLGLMRNVRLLVTGDFDKDGRDEFAFVNYLPGGGASQAVVQVYDNDVTSGWVRRTYDAGYGVMFEDMGVGDFNADGRDDLVLVRNVDRQVMVKNVSPWTAIATELRITATDWYAVAGGNISTDVSAPGDEIITQRDSGIGATYNVMMFRVVSGNLSQWPTPPPFWNFNPSFVSLSSGDLNGDGDDEVVMLRDPIQPKTSLLMVNPAGAAMNPFEQASGNGSAAFKIVRTGDLDGDGRDEVVILKSDRYRIYTEPNVGGQATEQTGAFYATPSVSNLPFMAIANVDGPGITQGPTLGVAPTTLSFSVDYGAVSPLQPLTITNVGSGSSFQWKAQVIEGSSWLLLDGQTGALLRNTPGQVNVSVRTDAVDPGTYPGKIRVTTTDSNVANNTVDIPVTLVLRDPGFAAFPSTLTIWQKIGGNPPPPTVTSEVRIVRPVKETPWTATALSRDAAAVLMEKLAIGKATVTTAGPMIDGIMVPPPDWLVFTPDHAKTPATMTVSVKAGTAAGTYHGVIVIAAGDPSLPEGVQLVNVTAIVADHFNFTFLPLVTK